MIRIFSIIMTLFLLAGCSNPQGPALASLDDANDPFEPFNRYMFEVNQGLDMVILRPVAVIYDGATPLLVRHMVQNITSHIRQPVVLANDLLQGEWDRARTTFIRIAVNSTLGGLGALDPATDIGFPVHDEDFGQTLAVAGVGEGAYVFVPIIGPVPPREMVGRLVDTLFNPLSYFNAGQTASLAATGAGALELRAQNIKTLDSLQAGSADYYATIRSAYRQRRNAEILNGAQDLNDLPEIGALGDPAPAIPLAHTVKPGEFPQSGPSDYYAALRSKNRQQWDTEVLNGAEDKKDQPEISALSVPAPRVSVAQLQ